MLVKSFRKKIWNYPDNLNYYTTGEMLPSRFRIYLKQYTRIHITERFINQYGFLPTEQVTVIIDPTEWCFLFLQGDHSF